MNSQYQTEQPWLPFSEVLLDWEQSFHDLMLNDQIRMLAYKAAINAVVKPGDVVVDLGAGTGILSQWALQAGAKKVYAIDLNADILNVAVDLINKTPYADSFIPINKSSYEVELPEKADVLISEIIGNIGDNEDFQPILYDAHQRFLKPTGVALPLETSSYIVPVCAPDAHHNVKNKVIATLNDNYDINSLLEDKGTVDVFNLYYDTIIAKSAYLSDPMLIQRYHDQWQQSSVYDKHFKTIIQQAGEFTGFKAYFIAQLSDEQVLDISGDNIQDRATSDSWKHAYLPIKNPIKVQHGDELIFNFCRRYPEQAKAFRQIYQWHGKVIRAGNVIGEFDQCLG